MLVVRRFVALIAVGGSIVAGCASDSSPTVEPAVGSVIALDRYEPLDLGLESTLGPSLVVGGDLLLVFGGIQPSGEGWVSVPSGSVVDLSTGAVSPVGSWPFDGAPYKPAMVWSGEEFVVVGSACARVTPDTDQVECNEPVRAAAFDPVSLRWRPLEGFDTSELTNSGPFAWGYGFSQGQALVAISGRDESELVGINPADGRTTSHGLFPPDEPDQEVMTCFAGERLSRAAVDQTTGVLETSRLDVEAGGFVSIADTNLEPWAATARGFVDCNGAPILYTASEEGLSPSRWLTTDASTWTEPPRLVLPLGSCCLAAARVGESLLLWPQAGTPAWVLDEGDDSWRSVPTPAVEPDRLLVASSALVVVSRIGEPRTGIVIGVVPFG